MGCGTSTPVLSVKESEPYSVACFGTGEAGKSSFFRMLTSLSEAKPVIEDSKTEAALFCITLRSNLLETLTAIVRFLLKFRTPTDSKALVNSSDILVLESKLSDLLSMSGEKEWTADQTELVRSLAKHGAIALACEFRDVFWVPENAPFYLANAHRFSQSVMFELTEKDKRLARVKTLGISECIITIKERKIRLIDVGGQRSERVKWLHMFSWVKEIFWFENIIGFSSVQFEDQKMNKLQESLALFQTIVNHEALQHAIFQVIFTKIDLLEETLYKFRPDPFPIPDPPTQDFLLRPPVEKKGELLLHSSVSSMSQPAIQSILDTIHFKKTLCDHKELMISNVPISSFRRRTSSTPENNLAHAITVPVWKQAIQSSFEKRVLKKNKKIDHFWFISVHDTTAVRELLLKTQCLSESTLDSV